MRYCRVAANTAGHGIHSPFVYEFVRGVLNDKSLYKEFKPIEDLRRQLLSDETIITITDHGAGSALNNGLRRRISDITRHAAKRPVVAQLIFRIVKYFQPQVIIELGTSLGISAIYLSAAMPAAIITTIEGSEQVASKARENLDHLHAGNVKVIVGTFEETLPAVLQDITNIDCVFVDGNHRKEPTLNYFNILLPHLTDNGFLIFDDIHWSREMESAWEAIKQHPQVTCSIDLFFIGLVFFRKELKVPQHFMIHYPYFLK